MMEFALKQPMVLLVASTVNVLSCTQDKSVTLKEEVIKLFWISLSALYTPLSKTCAIMEKTELTFNVCAANQAGVRSDWDLITSFYGHLVIQSQAGQRLTLEIIPLHVLYKPLTLFLGVHIRPCTTNQVVTSVLVNPSRKKRISQQRDARRDDHTGPGSDTTPDSHISQRTQCKPSRQVCLPGAQIPQ